MFDYKIISANREYAEQAAKIAIESWRPIRENHKQLLGDDELYERYFGNWEELKKEEVINQLLCDHGFVTVADDKVIGFISYSVDTNRYCGTILNNAVSSNYRNCGIGTAQYQFVLEEMKKSGLLCADVDTGMCEAQASARKAYEKAGFEKSIVNVHYYKLL